MNVDLSVLLCQVNFALRKKCKRGVSGICTHRAFFDCTNAVRCNFLPQINIDFSTRDLISKNIAEPTRKCFDEAQKLIYSLMAKDSFPRFLKSEIYKELVHSRQVGNHKKWLPFL